MELATYRQEFIQDVKTMAAINSDGTVSTFVSTVLDSLRDLNRITDYELCYSTGKVGRRNYRIDAYSYDEYDFSMSIFIAQFSGDNEIDTLTKTEATSLFEKVETFVEGCINGNLRYELEISTPAYDLADKIYSLHNVIRKYRLFILSDSVMSERISVLEGKKLCGVNVEYNIWDIGRLFKVSSDGLEDEHIQIEFKDFSIKGIPCLVASDVSSSKISCYLCVIPATVIANLYDRYGSKLLEGNVRSFLSTKGKINKGIKNTILERNGEDKSMFFSYNNGISATAANVVVEESEEGKVITSINNLQIVNGGQTTASLSSARYKEKADLNGIFIQMKLTVIQDEQMAQKIIPKISRYSNSQNKVSDADFFSNHEFNIEMEKSSRRLYAHSKDGQQYETHWFFERSRGQYEQEQSRMTDKQKESFKRTNPKEQLITKTDLAKYQNIWRNLPHIVSMGAQKNFVKFAEYIVDKWEKDKELFNDQFFREMVAIAIIFKAIDKKIPKLDWYENGYKANVVSYTMSYLHYLIDTNYAGSDIDLLKIWNNQGISDELEKELINMSYFVFKHITDENRTTDNVTEYCKKEECWTLLKNKRYDFVTNPKEYIISKDEKKKQEKEGKKEGIINNGIYAQGEVVEKTAQYWKEVLEFGLKCKKISESDIEALSKAARMDDGRTVPSDKESTRILNAEARLINEGFNGKG